MCGEGWWAINLFRDDGEFVLDLAADSIKYFSVMIVGVHVCVFGIGWELVPEWVVKLWFDCVLFHWMFHLR